MTSKELNLKLIQALPELKDLYDEEVEWQEGNDTGSHVVFGDVLTPYLLKSLNEGNVDSANRVFKFLETLLGANDEYVNGVITCSVLESIMDDADFETVESMLGTMGRKAWEELKNSM